MPRPRPRVTNDGMRMNGGVKGMRRTTMAWAAVIAGVGLAAAGCTHSSSGQWENPNKPWEEWSTDQNECRDLARDQAIQDFNPRSAPGQAPASSAGGRAAATDWSNMMDRYGAQRQEDTLFQRCMLQRGYRLVPRANPS